MKLPGKTCIVFGAAGDIGKACTTFLLQNGAKVAMTDVTVDAGQQIAADLNEEFPGNAVFIKCDVTKQDDVDNAFKTATNALGNIQICLNSVGITMETNWELGMDVNFGGCVRITESAKRWMSRDTEDDVLHIMQMASVMGLIPMELTPIYSASKHAMVGYVHSVAANRTLSGLDGFRVNAICPFFVDTQLLVNPVSLLPVEHWNVAKEAMSKENKLMSPDLVAEGMLQLIEDDSLNGECMMVHHTKGCFIDEATTKKFYMELL